MSEKTELGKFLSELRLANGELLRDMAVKLSVSSAFLSAVENGKKKMPEKWYSSLKESYGLSSIDIDRLKAAELSSSDKIELDVSSVIPVQRDLAIKFAREFDSFDEETSKKLMEFLNRHREVK